MAASGVVQLEHQSLTGDSSTTSGFNEYYIFLGLLFYILKHDRCRYVLFFLDSKKQYLPYYLQIKIIFI